MQRRSLTPAPLLAAALLTALSGCVDNGSTNVVPRPAPAPQTPSSARPGAISATVGNFNDTNNNGYRDTATAVAYVVAPGYAIPMKAKGSFEFRLETRDGQLISRWVFDENQTAQALQTLAPGPGYVFDLSLLALGSDAVTQTEGVVLCTFTPAGGEPIRAKPCGPVLVGPMSRQIQPGRPATGG